MGQEDKEGCSRCWISLNYVIWFSMALTFLVVQIVVSVVFLIVSRNEKPHLPLRAWNAVYISGCVAALVLLIWGYSVQKKVFTESLGGIVGLSVEEGDNRRAETCARIFKLIMHCFFAAWFIVGCIWISKASSSHAPLLFRLCMLNLIFCGIGYTIWFLISIFTCWCLVCVLSFFSIFWSGI